MPADSESRVAVITGAGGGLGSATAALQHVTLNLVQGDGGGWGKGAR